MTNQEQGPESNKSWRLKVHFQKNKIHKFLRENALTFEEHNEEPVL